MSAFPLKWPLGKLNGFMESKLDSPLVELWEDYLITCYYRQGGPRHRREVWFL